MVYIIFRPGRKFRNLGNLRNSSITANFHRSDNSGFETDKKKELKRKG